MIVAIFVLLALLGCWLELASGRRDLCNGIALIAIGLILMHEAAHAGRRDCCGTRSAEVQR